MQRSEYYRCVSRTALGRTSAFVIADDHFDAVVQFLGHHRTAELPIKVTCCETRETGRAISFCPECKVPVLDTDEWVLGEKAGEFAHVDCYSTERVAS